MIDDDFTIRPGRVGDRGRRADKVKSLVAQVRALSNKSGRLGVAVGSRKGTGRLGRGRGAVLRLRALQCQRRVLVKARVVRHAGARFAAAPLARHAAYLKRDGVTADGRDAELFGAGDEPVDGKSFAERCGGDRHHFRFIVSPEDAAQMSDIRAFTRELMADMAADLETRLDWAAVDHWNTDNPHVHILVRGKTADGLDLVIDRDYIREGMRHRAQERVTVELGPRTEQEVDRALRNEVRADRWTGLDRRLTAQADRNAGVIDLRPDPGKLHPSRSVHLIGRATKLERLGLATRFAPSCWTLKPDLEKKLRELGTRGDIIKTMHRAMGGIERHTDAGQFAMHDGAAAEPIVGRLVERGLHDELSGEAYAIIDGADGRTHHLRFGDLDATGDGAPGAIVELRAWTDRRGRPTQALWVQSDLALAEQIVARGATWLDRQLVSPDPVQGGGGFGAAIEQARLARGENLITQGLASRRDGRFILARDLLGTLRARELAETIGATEARTGLPHRPSAEGETVAGVYRERLQLASGRFAMIDDGLGFELVPWRPQLDRHLGKQVTGTMKSGGGIDWSLGRARGVAI